MPILKKKEIASLPEDFFQVGHEFLVHTPTGKVIRVTGVELVGGLRGELAIDAIESSLAEKAQMIEDLNDTVTLHGTQLTQNTEDILLRATKLELDGVNDRVTSAEAAINVNAEAITLNVSQEVFDAAEARLQSAESNITQQANRIDQTVSQLEYTDVVLGEMTNFNNLTHVLTDTGATFEDDGIRPGFVIRIEGEGELMQLRTVMAVDSQTQLSLSDEGQEELIGNEAYMLGSVSTVASSQFLQMAGSITARVTNGEFSTYQDQTDTAISARVTSSTYNSFVTQTNDTINNEILAEGKTRSRMTQDIEGFEFLADRLRSSNFNGSVNSSGEITDLGTAGWVLTKAGKFGVTDIKARGEIEATSFKAISPSVTSFQTVYSDRGFRTTFGDFAHGEQAYHKTITLGPGNSEEIASFTGSWRSYSLQAQIVGRQGFGSGGQSQIVNYLIRTDNNGDYLGHDMSFLGGIASNGWSGAESIGSVIVNDGGTAKFIIENNGSESAVFSIYFHILEVSS